MEHAAAQQLTAALEIESETNAIFRSAQAEIRIHGWFSFRKPVELDLDGTNTGDNRDARAEC